MPEHQLKTYQLLAAIHNLPVIEYVKNPEGGLQGATDRLWTISFELAGKLPKKQALGITQLAKLHTKLSPALRHAFPALAREPLPDAEFWKQSPPIPFAEIPQEALDHLKIWVESIEANPQYGTSQLVPDVAEKIAVNRTTVGRQ